MEFLDGRSARPSCCATGQLGARARAAHRRGVGARARRGARAPASSIAISSPTTSSWSSAASDADFVKVLDFGIAKLIAGAARAGDARPRPARSSARRRTCRPSSAAARAVDHRTDVYSLGVMMYQMFTGRLPFEADGLGELLLAHMTQQPVPLRELRARAAAAPGAGGGAGDGEDARGALPAGRRDAGGDRRSVGRSTRRCRATAQAPGTSWEVPSLKSHLDTIGGNVAAEAVRRTRAAGAQVERRVAGAGDAGRCSARRARSCGARARRSRRDAGAAARPTPPKKIAAAPAPTLPIAAGAQAGAGAGGGGAERRARAGARAAGDGAAATARRRADRQPVRRALRALGRAAQARGARAGTQDRGAVDRVRPRPHASTSRSAARRKPAAPATPPHETKPAVSDDGKPVYKGTKGKLITDFPTE